MSAFTFTRQQHSTRRFTALPDAQKLRVVSQEGGLEVIHQFRLITLILSMFLISLPLSGLAQSAGDEFIVMLPGNVPLVLVHVPAGTFQMGSPEGERGSDFFDNETQHQVTLTQDYYIGKTEVTQQQWQAVMETPMPTSCGDAGMGDDFPVYWVSWNDMAGP